MTINVTKYRLNPDRVFAGTSGSFGMEKLSFNFDDSWDFDTISVTFHPQRGKPIRVPILSESAEIDIPAEVMAHSGESRFVVSGVILGDGGEVERKAITLEGYVDVAYTADDKGGNTRKVTADVYDQLIDQATEIFNAAREDVERSAAEAAESASDAEGFANEAKEHADAAIQQRRLAEAAVRTANIYKNEAKKSAESAAEASSAAKKAAEEAQASERAAKTSEENAAGSAASAGEFADAASAAVTEAVTAKNDAVAAKAAAETAKEETRKLAETAEQTVKDTLQEAKDSGEFDGPPGDSPHIGANGNWYVGEMDTGIPAQGEPGNDYVLTDEDKQEIAGMIPGGGSGGSAGVVIFSVLYTDEQASFLEAPVVYPEGADMDTLLAAGQARMVMLTLSDSDDPTKLGVLLPMSVNVGGQTIVFAGTITGKDGNEAVMAELHTGTGEITVTPMVQNSAGSGSSGGGGVVTITDNGDGTYSSSHTPVEIAAMAQTGAVVAVYGNGVFPLMQYNADAAGFSLFMLDDDMVGQGAVIVTNDGVSFDTISYYVGEMHGADTDNAGTGGTVPAPAAGQQNMVLHGDGTWRAALSEDDKTDLVHRVIEKLPTWEGGTY